MAGSVPEPVEFETGPAPVIRGESRGTGRPLVLCHGLSATRKYVAHGSKTLPRDGYRLITYDARGHGESDPVPKGGYNYLALADDLGRVIDLETDGWPLILGGHSMGCHTVLAWALANPEKVAALILLGPVYTGDEDQDDLTRWDERADALARGGPDEFARITSIGVKGDAKVVETVTRIARDRAKLHQNPDAVAEALREIPRSRPFGSLGELRQLKMPALVVASHDEIDPGHPYDVAVKYAETLPDARLISEEPGESPLAWQGGMLSRAIASFLDEQGLGPDAVQG